jgi:predicted DNA-binding protein YlxM (UPF0122 family)
MSRKELLKRYLSRYNNAKIRIRHLEKLSDEIKQNVDSLKSPCDTTPRVKNSSVNSGAAECALRIIETEERILEQRKKLSIIMGEILDVFDFLPIESRERHVLELRYLNNYSVIEICTECKVCSSTYHALCDRGIKRLLKYQKINDTISKYEEALKSGEA